MYDIYGGGRGMMMSIMAFFSIAYSLSGALYGWCVTPIFSRRPEKDVSRLNVSHILTLRNENKPCQSHCPGFMLPWQSLGL